MCAACTGKLSDEQRQQLREGRAEQQIRVVKEGELLEAALESGRNLIPQLNRNEPVPESLEASYHARIKWLDATAENASLVESQLIDAYINAAIAGKIADNVQMAGTDSVLYTLPVAEYDADSVLQVHGLWAVTFSKKYIVMGLK